MIMRSVSRFGVSLAFVLASACGGGNGNNDTCGDGQKTGSEQCDDGNTTSGDGCSSTCTTETGRCGDHVVDVATEQCDDGNTTSGDGCSATCQNEGSALCGNGVIDGSEACDDHNTTSNDGCSSTCVVEAGYTCTGTPSVCTMGGGGTCAAPSTVTFTGTTTLTATLTGDNSTGTSQVGEAACDGAPEGLGNDHIYKFTTTDTRDVKIEFGANQTLDAIVRLMHAPCDLATEIKEFTGASDGCADSQVSTFLGYTNLAAGTYYIVVDGVTVPDDNGPFEVIVTASMPGCGNGMTNGDFEFCDDGNTTNGDGCNSNCEIETGYTCVTANATTPSVCMLACGNGTLETPEACDDGNTTAGDGCSPTCTIETGYVCDTTVTPSLCALPGCGNHILEATEECEDGNTVAGDRCSPTCTLEFDTLDTEPNDTTPQVLTAGNHIIKGQFGGDPTATPPTDDVDLYSFTLAATSTVEIETYFTINGKDSDYGGVGTNPAFDCTTADDTGLALFAAGVDVTMDTLAIATDSDDGDSFCSYLGLHDADGPDPTQLVNLAPGTYTIKVHVDPTATAAVAPRRYMLDLKITPMNATPVAPAPGDIEINEFLAADGSAMNGGIDSNCDGSFTNTDDEFIEFVNVSTKVLDLTGLTVKDGGSPAATPPVPPQLQFTFAPAGSGSMTLQPGKAVVVWGGGSPNCPGVTNWFTAPPLQHSLSLNDAGDSITLATGGATPVTITTITYPSQTVGTSSNLNPDITGTTYALHSAITGHVGNASPGKKSNGTAF